jgi:ribose 5-phosphate isomerase B
MKIYLGADHRGFELKEKVFHWLADDGYHVEDHGAYEYDKGDDYTTYASKVASQVADNKNSRGILFCGSGVGVDVVANKFDGVRSSIGINPEQVKAGRRDDNMNILVIAADFVNEDEMKTMIKTFLETDYEKAERRERRLGDISKIEKNN